MKINNMIIGEFRVKDMLEDIKMIGHYAETSQKGFQHMMIKINKYLEGFENE